jgi:hypothetical protein
VHPARIDVGSRAGGWPPHEVRTVCAEYLALVDEAAPGLVEGLYLHGSLGFGEWYDGRSDIDFVAVTDARLEDGTVAVLRDVHARRDETYPRPPFDGFYVTWADLARTPYDCPDVPCTLGGVWRDAGRVDVQPVTWHELAWHGATLRGPEPAALQIWTDRHALRAYTHHNLAGYWSEQVAGLARLPDEAGRPDTVAWFVLGLPRLHHILARDALTSKSRAAAYALEEFGEAWRPLLAEALAYRVSGERAGLLDEHELAAQTIRFAELVLARGLAIPV